MVCNLSPICFSCCGFSIHWYSLAYIVGIIVSIRVTKKISYHFFETLSDKDLDSFISMVVFGIIIGGRLGYVIFYEPNFFINNPAEIIKIWHGGMAFYGGFLGVITVMLCFCKRRGLHFLKFTDMWSISAPIGLFLGRCANFVNGELLGYPSNVPWHVIFHDGVPRHPSQLYEAFSEGILLFCVMWISFKSGASKQAGKLSGIFCTGYGIARFISEFFREPDSAFSYTLYRMTNLNFNQYISICMCVLGIILLCYEKGREKCTTFCCGH